MKHTYEWGIRFEYYVVDEDGTYLDDHTLEDEYLFEDWEDAKECFNEKISDDCNRRIWWIVYTGNGKENIFCAYTREWGEKVEIKRV